MNIEPVIINYLIEELHTESVYAEVPEVPEEEYFIIDKTGSDTENRITTSTIAIQSYGPSKMRASEMNENVKTVMDDICRLSVIGDCKLMSDYNFSNIAKREHRYQAVFEITHY